MEDLDILFSMVLIKINFKLIVILKSFFRILRSNGNFNLLILKLN